jgi:multiple sugar transport system substrate-binding protein
MHKHKAENRQASRLAVVRDENGACALSLAIMRPETARFRGVKRLRRRTIGGLLAALVVCGLAGCGRKQADRAEVKLTLGCWEGPEGLASLTKLLDRYKQQHPNVSIEIQQVPGLQYYQRLKIQIAAGVAPDIMQLAYNELPTFAERNALEPLDGLIARDHFPISGMFPEVVPALKYKGRCYGLPRGWTTFVLYYNKDMFREAGIPFPHDGWTWDDFLSACRKITKDTDGDGKPDRFGCDAPTQADGITTWIWQNGGLMFTPDMKRCLLDSPASIDAMQFLSDCQYKYRVFPSPEQAQDLGGGGEMFKNGKQAMFIQGRWACQLFRDAAYADGRKIDWDVAELPVHKRKATVLFANCYVLRKGGPNLEEAWKLMQWLTGVEGQKRQAATGRDMPSFVSVGNSPIFLNPNQLPEHDGIFLKAAKSALPVDTDPNFDAYGELINAELAEIFIAHKDPSKSMREVTPKINAILRRSQQ